jgi:hypothetical protein
MTERKLRRPGTGGRLLLYCAIAWLSVAGLAIASEYHGQVTFGGLPLPGSTVKVTATQGDKTAVAITDSQGLYSFPDLADGTWTITVEMTGFTPIKQEVTVAPNAPAGAFAMKLLTLEQMRAAAKPVKVEAAPVVSASTAAGASTAAAGTPAAAGTGTAAKKGAAAKTDTASAAAPAAPAAAEAPVVAPEQDATSQQANDGILINGSVNNAATSQYSMSQAFGNMRNGGRFLYNGGLSLVLTNSAFNAEPYSLTGLPTANRSYNNFTFGGQIGGPLKLKHVIHYVPGSSFTVGYSRVQNSSLNTQSALVPTLAQRAGDLSGQAVFNPATGTQFTGNIPISSQAQALLNLYPLPLPSLAGNQQNNYQASLASDTHSDGFQININMPASHHDFLNGAFSIQSSRSSSTSLFKFHDSTDTLGMNSNVTWQHSFKSRMWLVTTYSFNRNRSLVTPNFANRVNIEGVVAGINGASTDPKYWGPPSLGFTQSSINGLSDATSSNIRGETNSLSVNWNWYHAGHTITAGGDFRRRENNYLTQSNPDGSLGFNGTATQQIVNGKGVAGTGSDFADFLLGIPDTSQIAYGNEDKYLRQSIYDLYISDDFRVNPELSVKWGVRWEYGAPITELQGRLVNLDIGPGFTAEQPVVGSSPVGVLSGQSYPSSMVRPDRSGIAPNVGIAWRPISGSSLLVRSGYQISNDTSVYQSTAQSMMQQHGTAQTPLSTSLSISGSPTCQLSMVSPFAVQTCSTTTTTPDSFAIDPNFRVGYIQIWLLQVQRDLPASMQMIATYTGNKGTRGVQEFFPNTAPSGGTDPYAAYPAGYLYRTSNGNSTHEEGSLMLRRRPRAGLAASATYTYAKSLDDDYSLGGGGGVGGGPGVAQNWLDLSSGQRGLSTFDQRQVLSANAQYTTGMGLGGKALMSGWKGLAYKEWTVSTTIKVASGLPATPTVPETMMGAAGSSGIIRANYVGGQVHLKSGGQFLNPAAFATPAAGQWGTARRDSITGPSQFSLNAAMSRTFRLSNQLNLYTELDATNVLNHVTYPGWNTTYTPNSTQFGKPLTPNPMRTMSITMRLRF